MDFVPQACTGSVDLAESGARRSVGAYVDANREGEMVFRGQTEASEVVQSVHSGWEEPELRAGVGDCLDEGSELPCHELA